ncbi:DUF7079 family protein [Zestomonas carbonaria]|uniref:DUF7079 domain-containing protein n=1 Tax=Zestomonas carbonaria TaxID=2762745 RepID=A0A7U7I9P5_9GAMM|nr:hypothetical protein [Pseudomonas carbonaria]CAD5107127.1 hypothetical protein PSEWESI4_01398 [Pseudomonas carbonaria]
MNPEASRIRVWQALSTLWLDTELQESELRWVAAELVASGLSRQELEAIYLYEVAPLLWPNLWVAAGAWAGFDAGWLAAGCLRNRRRRESRWHRWKCRLLRRPMTYATASDWRRIQALLDQEFH